MHRNRDVQHELDQAALAAKVEKADSKVEQAKREADKIRAQLSDAPQTSIPTATGGWVRHAGAEPGIQEHHRADGTTTYRKRATVAGKGRFLLALQLAPVRRRHGPVCWCRSRVYGSR
jgi:multidrug resistance efflux pump